MVKKYGSKREKFQVTKWQAADEQRPVREMEQEMDVELFLEGQARWEEDSPHHLAIMHKLFQHAAAEGQKEVEWIVHQGCWAEVAPAEPRGGHTCHSAGGARNFQGRTARAIHGGLQTAQTTRFFSWGNLCYVKSCCPPLKTTKGRRQKRHLQPQQGPIQKTPIPLEVEPPRREKGTAQWRGVWTPYAKPTKKCWPQQLPSKKK